MTATPSIDPARVLEDQLAQASRDLLRELLTTFVNNLMSAEADSVCGAAYEGELIRGARTGDTGGFALLTERFRCELLVHCYRMLASYDDAQDLTQETFRRASARRESIEGRASLRTWLYRIATNACLDFLEKRRDRTPIRWLRVACGGQLLMRSVS